MAGGFAAALLDELMGRNRNVNPADRVKPHWSDPEVCKFFLCAFCPNDLFTNTKSNLGRCTKIHDEEFRISYQKSPRYGNMGYERDFTKYLEGLISEIDRKISRGQQRLVLNSQPNPNPSTPQAAARLKRIEFLTERISQLVEEAEQLGCEGNVEQAQSVMVMCEQMRDERSTLTSMIEAEMKAELDPSKAMEVCPVCGALLVLADIQLRPKDHVNGKQHTGYARIREYIQSRRATEAGGASSIVGERSSNDDQRMTPAVPETIDLDSDSPTEVRATTRDGRSLETRPSSRDDRDTERSRRQYDETSSTRRDDLSKRERSEDQSGRAYQRGAGGGGGSSRERDSERSDRKRKREDERERGSTDDVSSGSYRTGDAGSSERPDKSYSSRDNGALNSRDGYCVASGRANETSGNDNRR